jgi:glucose-6-phosphate dehydrogenase assembly protein OpcA
MTTQGFPTSLGGQTQIDIRAIEHELNELWKSAAQGDDDLPAQVTRACTLNLIAVIHGSAAEHAITAAVDRLTGTHPHRAIVVNVDLDSEQNEPPIEAWVQAHCQLPTPGRPQVCCEQITITARGEGIMRVPGTILPLLVPDVPVVVWYPEGEPFGDPLFEKLAELADRVVVDSEQFVDPEGGLRRLADRVGQEPPVGDLAWGRLTIWRELVAQCFDATTLSPQLHTLDRVRITYGARCSRVPALLLAAWLSARLGWKLIGRSGPTESITLRMARPNGEVRLELRRGTVGITEGHLASIELHGPNLRILVAPGERPETLLTRIEALGRPTLLRGAPWQRFDSAELLAAELRLLSRDRPYEVVAHHAATII